MQQPNYETWLSRDLWALWEFTYLAYGLEPNPPEGDLQLLYSVDEANREWVDEILAPCRALGQQARMSIAAGSLQVSEYDKQKNVAPPIVFIGWAIRNGVELPNAMLKFGARHQSDGTAISAHEVGRTRTQCRYALWNAEYRQLRKEHPKKSKRWCSIQVAKMEIADGCSSETIRRHLTK
jgi:hypothetical protein